MKYADRSRLPEVGADRPFLFPLIVHHTLGNGLKVRSVQRPDAAVITLVLQIEGGAGADPASRHGLAAITADLLDEGTGAMDAMGVSDALARLGADFDLDVGADTTTISMTTLARSARPAAALLSAIVTRPALRREDFERVRQLRLDRLRQMKDLPPAMAERAFLQLLYGDHPYGHLPLGSLASLSPLTLEDVEQFHASRYRPARATLVIGGPLSSGDALQLAEEAFGVWAAAGTASADGDVPASAVVPPSNGSARLAIVSREGAAQSELRIGHLSARRDTPDYFALLVMNAVMGGQFVSRINLKLREEKGYTYGARTGFDWRRGLAPFVLQASVHSRATADAIRDSLNELEAIRGDRPPSADELVVAQASLTRGYARNFETVPQVTRSVAQLASFGLPDSYFASFVSNVQAVTGDAVMSAAERYIDPRRLTTLIVGDLPAIRESLLGLGLGEPSVIPSEV